MNSNNDSYASMMSKSVSGLFRDPLSDSTKTKQTSLLITSVVSILLAQKIILPFEVQLVGIKGNISNSDVIIWITGCTVVYFAIIYTISVIQDFLRYRYEKIEMFLALDKSSLETSKEVLNMGNAAIKSEEEKQIQILYNQLLKQESAKIISKSTDIEIKRIALDNIKQLSKKMIDELKQIGEMRDRVMKSLIKRSQLELQASKWHDRLNKLRLFFEVIFPLSLSILAVYQSLILTKFLEKLVLSIFK